MAKQLVLENQRNHQTNAVDLLSLGDLSVELIIGITNFVETFHHQISLKTPSKNALSLTRISPLIYQSIRKITHYSAFALSPLLKRLNPIILKPEAIATQQKLLAILNGVIGDHLQGSNNDLATSMQFRVKGKVLSEQSLAELIDHSQGKILVLVHGSCMNDLLWRHKEHDHGEALARDLGLTPIYLTYNSGLHISENGRQFSQLLESLLQSTNKPVELSILAHSMGGLVSRSACYYAQKDNKNWLKQLNKMIFLGTPHHGAPLEQMGYWLEQVLSSSAYTAHFTKLTQIRSNGITDLRHGYIIDEDWLENEATSNTQKHPIGLPQSVECFSVAAAALNKASILSDALVGDGLVTVNSALGKHKNKSLQLDFPIANQMIIRDVNHMELLSNSDVYLQLKNWLGSFKHLN